MTSTEQRLHAINRSYDEMLVEIARLRTIIVSKMGVKSLLTDQGAAYQLSSQLSQISPHSDDHTEVIKRIREECIRLGFKYAKFKQVPNNYYQIPLEARRDILGAPTLDHLCKSLIMENTRFQGDDPFADRNNCKYYCIVLQYTARLHSDKMTRFVSRLNKGKLSNQSFNFRLADEKEQQLLTGFGHNAVVPIGMANSKIPIVLSDRITKLAPYKYFWMGAGEVDWKLEVNTQEFIDITGAFVADITYDQ